MESKQTCGACEYGIEKVGGYNTANYPSKFITREWVTWIPCQKKSSQYVPTMVPHSASNEDCFEPRKEDQ